MPALTGSNISAGQLNHHLRGTPLAGTGGAFVQAGRRHRVDPRLLVSIASAESSLGRHANGYNPFGWGPGKQFGSWADAINTVAAGLRSGYLDQGLNSIEKIGAKYAPSHAANDPTGLNSNWVKNVRSFYRSLGGSGSLGAPGAPASGGRVIPGVEPTRTVKPTDLRPFLSEQMMKPAWQRRPTDALGDLVQFVRSHPDQVVTTPGRLGRVAPGGEATSERSSGRLGKLSFAPGADRSGMKTQADIIAFARRVAAQYGRPLRVGTGTNHSQMTVNGNQSQHWTGHAVDIPASGSQLLRLGRAALIAAGMPRAQAMKQTGGLFNVNGRQVIFRTNEGGNHWNHLHLGA